MIRVFDSNTVICQNKVAAMDDAFGEVAKVLSAAALNHLCGDTPV